MRRLNALRELTRAAAAESLAKLVLDLNGMVGAARLNLIEEKVRDDLRDAAACQPDGSLRTAILRALADAGDDQARDQLVNAALADSPAKKRSH